MPYFDKRSCQTVKSDAMFDAAGVSPESDEWYTPSWVFRSLDVQFDLDPCSPGSPPSSVTAARHLTKDDNGLTAAWEGSVWLNPPFSGKRPWYERLVAHGDGIALMPARTETHDLQDYMQAAQALLFLKGRIYFERGTRPGANANGATTTPPFGIVLCAYGEKMASALLDSKLLGVRAKVYSQSAKAP
jgi:DNA N-6-adenine-methyltransferase (Dam)